MVPCVGERLIPGLVFLLEFSFVASLGAHRTALFPLVFLRVGAPLSMAPHCSSAAVYDFSTFLSLNFPAGTIPRTSFSIARSRVVLLSPSRTFAFFFFSDYF